MGIWELLIIVLLVLVLFSSKKLPNLGRGLGKAISEFKRSVRERDDKDHS